MWSTYIFDFLLFLSNYGCALDPFSAAAAFDFNGNGILDNADFLEMLSRQPPIQNTCVGPK